MRILLVPWISFKPLAEEDGARLGEGGSEKRKQQNYFAKSEACAGSLHWKAEFQHLLRLLIFLGLLYLSQRDASGCQKFAV